MSSDRHVWMLAKSFQSCPTLCDPMNCSLPGSSLHGILQARILEWVPMPSSRDFPNPGVKPTSHMSPELAGSFFTTSATWEAPQIIIETPKKLYFFAFLSEYAYISNPTTTQNNPRSPLREDTVLLLCYFCFSLSLYVLNFSSPFKQDSHAYFLLNIKPAEVSDLSTPS